MNKKEVVNRLKLAAKEYISNHTILSAVIALIFGKEVDEIDWLVPRSAKQLKQVEEFHKVLNDLIRNIRENETKQYLKNLQKNLDISFLNHGQLLVFFCHLVLFSFLAQLNE